MSSRPLDPERLVDDDAAALVERNVELGEKRARAHAGGPDERSRRDAHTVREDRLARRRTDSRVVPTWISTPRRSSRRAAYSPSRRGISGRIFGAASTSTQRWGRLAQRRVRAERGLRHVVQLRQRLDPRVAGADEDEAELGRIVRVDRRALELQEDVVAERDRVGEVLEAHPVLGETRDGEDAGARAERDHEPLVADLERPGERCRRRPLSRLDRGSRRRRAASSACGHISRSGTTTWRGSSVPDAASGRSGVYSMKFSCETIVAPRRFRSRAT